MYLESIFLLVLVGVVLTVLKYSKEGDILTFTGTCPQASKIRTLYPSKEKVVERLHALLVYKESYVRWNTFLLVAIFTSLIVLSFLRERVRIAEVIILSCFLFLAIDLPNRWAHAHIQKGVIQEATFLAGWYGAAS